MFLPTALHIMHYKSSWKFYHTRHKERRAYRDGIKRKGDKIGMVVSCVHRWSSECGVRSPKMSLYHPYIVAWCWYVKLDKESFHVCSINDAHFSETKGSGKVKWKWRKVAVERHTIKRTCQYVFCTNATL